MSLLILFHYYLLVNVISICLYKSTHAFWDSFWFLFYYQQIDKWKNKMGRKELILFGANTIKFLPIIHIHSLAWMWNGVCVWKQLCSYYQFKLTQYNGCLQTFQLVALLNVLICIQNRTVKLKVSLNYA